MNNNEFSKPQRMSPAAFFIIFIKSFKDSIAPILVASSIQFFDNTSDNKIGLGSIILLILGSAFAIAFIYALCRYFPTKFYITNGNLIFIHGLLTREKTSIPLNRVHSLRTKKGILYRLLDLRGIVFDTLATRQAEIELIVDEYEWKRMLSIIDQEEHPQTSASMDIAPENPPMKSIHFPNKNLFLAALCQNHLKGMAIFGSFFSVIIGNLSDIPEEATDATADFLETYFDKLLSSPLDCIIMFAIIYLVILIIWLGKVLLQYSNMTMRYDDRLLSFAYGMFTRNSCRFFFNKVCTIRIKRNFLEKHFGFYTLMLRQALNVSAKKEEDNMKIYGSDSSSFFLKWWLGSDYLESSEIISAKSGKGLFWRSIILPSVIFIVSLIILLQFHLLQWVFLPLLIFPFYLWRGVLRMQHSAISLKESYFVIHQGAFAKTENFIKYSNIEVVKIQRSPFTRRFHRVSLIISTSGTDFRIRSIKEEEAQIIYELLLLNVNNNVLNANS